MVAPAVSVFVDSCKLIDGERVALSVGVVVHPDAMAVREMISVGVVLFGQKWKTTVTLLLSDFPLFDSTTGTFRKVVFFSNAPKHDLGAIVASRLSGEEETTKLYVFCKDGHVFSDLAFDLTSEVLLDRLFAPDDGDESGASFVVDRVVLEKVDEGLSGEFSITFPGKTINSLFLRRFRKDFADQEEGISSVQYSTEGSTAVVTFLDGGVVEKTGGIWGYRGWASTKNTLRLTVSSFIDRIAWEILSLKDWVVRTDSLSLWDPLTLVWAGQSTGEHKEYLAIRSSILILLDSFRDKIHTGFDFDRMKRLLGESVVSRESIDLFFDVSFLVLEQCEKKLNGIGLLEVVDFSLGGHFDCSSREVKLL